MQKFLNRLIHHKKHEGKISEFKERLDIAFQSFAVGHVSDLYT